jgi:hypothetical protein
MCDVIIISDAKRVDLPVTLNVRQQGSNMNTEDDIMTSYHIIMFQHITMNQ